MKIKDIILEWFGGNVQGTKIQMEHFYYLDFGLICTETEKNTKKAFREISKLKMRGTERIGYLRNRETVNTFKVGDGSTVKTVVFYKKLPKPQSNKRG